jgi:hypothetical protein
MLQVQCTTKVNKEDPINTLFCHHTSLSTHPFHGARISSNNLLILCEAMYLPWLLRHILTRTQRRIIVSRTSHWEVTLILRKLTRSLAGVPTDKR